jgi:hypothetical protein
MLLFDPSHVIILIIMKSKQKILCSQEASSRLHTGLAGLILQVRIPAPNIHCLPRMCCKINGLSIVL